MSKIDWGRFFTSKTIWVSLLTIAIGIVEFLSTLPPSAGVAMVTLGIINIVIRFLTNDALTKPKGDK